MDLVVDVVLMEAELVEQLPKLLKTAQLDMDITVATLLGLVDLVVVQGQ